VFPSVFSRLSTQRFGSEEIGLRYLCWLLTSSMHDLGSYHARRTIVTAPHCSARRRPTKRWTVVSLGSLSVTENGALCVALERPDDQILARRLDDLFGD